jgi:hypothetical protein
MSSDCIILNRDVVLKFEIQVAVGSGARRDGQVKVNCFQLLEIVANSLLFRLGVNPCISASQCVKFKI